MWLFIFRAYARGALENYLEIAHASIGPTNAKRARNFSRCGWDKGFKQEVLDGARNKNGPFSLR